MPGAFGHLIGAWIFGKVYTRLTAHTLTRLMWAALLFGAIAPDADFLIEWTIEDFHPHRTFTHSIVGALFAGVMSFVALHVFSHVRKISITKPVIISCFFALGVMTHILLDLSFSDSGLQVLWPFTKEWITLNGPLNHQDGMPTYEQLKRYNIMTTIDMGLGTAWLAYLFWKKKVSFD